MQLYFKVIRKVCIRKFQELRKYPHQGKMRAPKARANFLCCICRNYLNFTSLRVRFRPVAFLSDRQIFLPLLDRVGRQIFSPFSYYLTYNPYISGNIQHKTSIIQPSDPLLGHSYYKRMINYCIKKKRLCEYIHSYIKRHSKSTKRDEYIIVRLQSSMNM